MCRLILKVVVVVVVAFSPWPGLGQDQQADPVATQNSPTASETDEPTELTPKQIEAHAKKAKEINDLITEAGLMFKRKAYPGSVKKIEKARQLMSELVAQGNDDLLKKLEHDYSRLETAQTLLDDKGQKLKPLPPLKEMGALAAKKSDNASANQVSFTKEIAPILVQRCGQCHVLESKGDFSSASFAAMNKGSKKGQVLSAGDPANSVLFTLVESGKMPPRSKGIPKQELQTIKDWISQGAKYDGANENDDLSELVKGGNATNQGRGQGR